MMTFNIVFFTGVTGLQVEELWSLDAGEFKNLGYDESSFVLISLQTILFLLAPFTA